MSNVIDFTKYLDSEALKRICSGVHSKAPVLPNKYSIKMYLENLETSYTLTYDISNKKMKDTPEGRDRLVEHLFMIIVDLCQEDPALIIELYEELTQFFNDKDLDEDE